MRRKYYITNSKELKSVSAIFGANSENIEKCKCNRSVIGANPKSLEYNGNFGPYKCSISGHSEVHVF